MNRKRKHCAFLVMEDPGDFVTDYALAIEPLSAIGWDVTRVAWRRPETNWDDFNAVYICTPWDYTDAPGDFMRVLRDIHASRAVLVNPLPLVEWNLDKRYLRELEGRGVPIVPSAWHETFDPGAIQSAFDQFAVEKLVIKPVVGANAADTFVLSRNPASWPNDLAGCYTDRPHVLQPFIDNIESEGEYSLFFLGGTYSHAIRKVPASGDFRVQEEHGADILPASPEASLLHVSEQAIAAVSPAPCYARADFVRDAGGQWLLMELEMIEPSLYLRMSEDAPTRFATAFDQYVP